VWPKGNPLRKMQQPFPKQQNLSCMQDSRAGKALAQSPVLPGRHGIAAAKVLAVQKTSFSITTAHCRQSI
jgi:hypothetical protein